MHSTRKRTVRCSVCPGGVCPGGVCRGGGGCLPRRVSARGGSVCLGEGVCLEGGVWQTHPCGQNDRHVYKTLPCHNYIADSNKNRMCTDRLLTISPSARGGGGVDADPWKQTPWMQLPPGHVTCDACWEANNPPREQNDTQV